MTFFACNDSSTIKKREILDDDVFLSVLKDIHKSDGIVTASKLGVKMKSDSVSIYNYILKKHNISRDDFKKTVQYYSLHTDQYNVFYDSLTNYFDTLENIIKVEMEIEKEKRIEERKREKDSLNLWPLKDEWELPEDGETNPIAFSIPTEEHGTYVFSASIRIFRDDRSKNLRMTIIANYSDGTKDLNSAGTMVKDGKFEKYEVRLKTNENKKLISISGWLLDHSKGTEKKHVSVKEVELRKHFDEEESINLK